MYEDDLPKNDLNDLRNRRDVLLDAITAGVSADDRRHIDRELEHVMAEIDRLNDGKPDF